MCGRFTLTVTGWLGAVLPAQHHERGLSCTAPARGRDPNSKFEGWFLLNAHCFHPIVKSKTPKLNHPKSGNAYIEDMVIESCSHTGRVRNFKDKTKEGKTQGKHCVKKESGRKRGVRGGIAAGQGCHWQG